MTLQEAVQKFHWIKIGDDGVPEIYLDHHALSTFRMCEARFELEIMNHVRPKQMAWFLDFGVVFHEAVEKFYLDKRDNKFDLEDWLKFAIKMWQDNELDKFSDNKTFKVLGGLPGFLALLASYQQFYAAELANMRVVGTEIAFGKGKEVFLGELELFTSDYHISGFMGEIKYIPKTQKVRCYLSGRIDLLMDDGKSIGPMDHKTATFFTNDISKMYDPQEGMTGYVFATKQILKTMFPDLQRDCNKIWMNFVQVTPPGKDKAGNDKSWTERFKRIPIFKTDYQLEQYRLRQLSTFEKIFNMVLSGRNPDWNTMVCNNYFHNKCSYRDLHRQSSPENMLIYLKNDFKIVNAWNPDVEKKEDANE